LATKHLRPRVLYIVYWGAGEPLGQSLVVPAVKTLAELGTEITLITFEKPVDLMRSDYIAGIRESFSASGINWFPLQYHKRPKVPATLLDVASGIARSVASRMSGAFDIVHARTFVGGLIGTFLAPLLGSKLIYHNEGFYPDEQVDGGVWKRDSRSHRIARYLEDQMYSRADGIIAMSHRGRCKIEERASVAKRQTPVIVVPSCVDLTLFQMNGRPMKNEGIRLVYSGSVGGRYILDKVGRFVSIANEVLGRVHLEVLTRTDRETVAGMLRRSGLKDDLWSMASVPYSSMPERLSQSRAGLFFLTRGISEHGCSPTKIGEYWAMGLPVITTPNVSDTDEIIRVKNVGVIVEDHTDAAYRKAARELKVLLEDVSVAERCRAAAEEHYALKPACERQFAMYKSLVGCMEFKL
jgi:glycosyltransferase involved in cell wall biosynthesis